MFSHPFPCLYPCSPVGGQLIEINSRLLEEPDILLDAPYEEGFLAILYVKAPQREKALAKGIEGDEAYAAAVNGTSDSASAP